MDRKKPLFPIYVIPAKLVPVKAGSGSPEHPGKTGFLLEFTLAKAAAGMTALKKLIQLQQFLNTLIDSK